MKRTISCGRRLGCRLGVFLLAAAVVMTARGDETWPPGSEGKTTYYLRQGSGFESSGNSSFDGSGSGWGWSTTRDGSREAAGITGANTYLVQPGSGSLRTGSSSWSMPTGAILGIESNATLEVKSKFNNGTLTLNPLYIRGGGVLKQGVGDSSSTVTLKGNFICEKGSTVALLCTDGTASDSRTVVLDATLTGAGEVCSYPYSSVSSEHSGAMSAARLQKITGDLTAFAGDIRVFRWPGMTASYTLEIVNAASLPSDDAETHVVVTNGATLKVDVDWDSGITRAWDFGSDGMPTVNVAEGKTVTIRGPVSGTVGLNKTGSGTLALAYPGLTPITITGTGSIDAETLADYAVGTQTDMTMDPVGDVVYAGTAACPKPVVRDLDGNVLDETTDYTLSYANNTAPGVGTVVATAAGSHVGTCAKAFNILASAYDIASIPAMDCSTGFGKAPSGLTVTNRYTGVRLAEGTDYSVSATNNDGVGTATAIVTGLGAYAYQRATAPFTITATKLDDDNISVSDPSVRMTTVDGKYVYVFTNGTSALSVTAKRGLVLHGYLLVGGGGAGGNTMGGGGGGGGVTNATGLTGVSVSRGETFTVTLGAGGTKGGTDQQAGNNGSATTLGFGGNTYSVAGGGGGGGWSSTSGKTGGSGGGGAQSAAGGSGTDGIGYAGAAGGGNSASGGGGGAGGAGCAAANSRAGNGGPGLTTWITGEARCFGGGGGGGGSSSNFNTYNGGYGGTGGGGNGGKGAGGSAGAAGTGGGGGGGGWTGSNQYGGAGGSGAAILVLSPADFEVDPIPTQYVVPGGARPTLVVRDPKTLLPLTEGEEADYVVSYADNTSSGTATATVSGRGTYAGKSVLFRFKVLMLYRVTGYSLLEEGTGLGWDSPVSYTNALAQAAVAGGEIWLIEGTYAHEVDTVARTLGGDVIIRGGFSGSEAAASERQSGARTKLDGAGAYDLLKLTSGSAKEIVFDRIDFCRAKNRAVNLSGAANLTAYDCTFQANGRATNGSGKGLYLSGSSSPVASFSNCLFAANMRTSSAESANHGAGLYITSYGRLDLADCTFVTNGMTYAAQNNFVQQAYGAAIYANATPVRATRCRFAGNGGVCRYDSDGGTLRLNGACGGSVFRNCAFVGNHEVLSYQTGTSYRGGSLVVELSAVANAVTIENCTFAYNMTRSYYGAGGLNVVKGTVNITNSLFYGNKRYNGGTAGIGADLYLQANGRANVSYCWFTSNDLDRVSAVTTGALVQDHVYYGNPLLVTTDATAKSAMDSNSSYGASATMDAHLRSPGGYVLNDGSEGPATSDFSLAIDAGNPASAYADEPTPNGKRVNLGAYGNTAEASKTPVGVPQADAFSVGYPGGVSRPVVSLTMGLASGVGYNATVTLACKRGETVVSTKTYENVHTGDVLAWAVPYYFEADEVLNFAYTISLDGLEDISAAVDSTVTGSKPIFADKSGGANVVHVRAGADCLMDGSDWANAYPDLETAIAAAMADGTKNEIWVATNTFLASATITLPHAFALRGGFRGWETSAAERPAKTVTTIANAGAKNGLEVTAAAGNTFTLDRFVIQFASTRGLKKSGAGDLVCTDCAFLGNGRSVRADGRGVHATGTSSTTATFANCRFEGNMRASQDESCGSGCGAYLSTFKRVYLTDCTFATNGTCRSSSVSGSNYAGQWRASAIFLNAAPVTAVGTRFAGHCNSFRNSSDGGAVCLDGAGGGSAFTNCVWVGGGDWISYGGGSSSYSGALVVNLSAVASTVDLKNCTVAYNTTCSGSSPGINIVKGTVRATDSIFWGNVRGNSSATAGTDIGVQSNGRLVLDHVILTATDTITTSSAANVTSNDVVFVDPLFVHAQDVFLDTLSSSGNYKYPKNTAAGYAGATTLDVHLKSSGGYFLNDGSEGPFTAQYSPAIDAGNPDSDCANEPEPNGDIVNLGAYGNTAQASKSIVVATFAVDPVGTQIYEGTALTPSVVVRDIATGLVLPNANFDISYDGNDRAGTAAITVSGKAGGAYAGQTAYQTFVVIGRLYVTAEADGTGDGKTWATATTWEKAYETGCLQGAEIWMKSGTYTLASSATNMSVAADLIVRGGFNGDETSRDARPADGLSTIDGESSKETMLFKNGSAAPVTLDRLALTRSSKRGLYKDGVGDLTLKDCTISMCARSVSLSGRGLYATGGSTATLTITNCVFADNMYNAYGENVGACGGSQFDNCKRVYLTDCRYFRNGQKWMGDQGATVNGGQGSAIYASSSPLVANRCRFAGNAAFIRRDSDGGCVKLVGAGAGSVFTNCAFIANAECRSYQPNTSSQGGALVINLNAKANPVDVVNCTFAYNVSGQDQGAAGLTVITGTANVRNSIFYQNLRGQTAASAYGRDICLKGNGCANVAHTLVTGTDVDCVSEVTVGSLAWDTANIYAFDPLFVTDTNDFANVLSWNSGKTVCWLDPNKVSTFTDFDVHLRSKAGYCVNGGGTGEATEETSDAIDRGDPASDWTGEYNPNGERVNLGAYGNTAQASRSVVGQPKAAGYSVTFPDGLARPRVTLVLGLASGIDYNAKVAFVCSTGGVTVATAAFEQLHNGATVVWNVPDFFRAGTAVTVSYRITAPNATAVESSESAPAEGAMPANYGKGGGAHVIHVMEGADCRKTGANWIDAYPDFASALDEAATNSAKTEIWVSKKTDYCSAVLTRTAPLAIRGGFAGSENRADERPASGRAVFDNGTSRNGLTVENAADAPVTLDRVEINRSSYRALLKTGSGDLNLIGCAFRGNGRSNVSSGKGVHASGGGVAHLVCTNCVFEGNMLMSGTESENNGGGMYLSSFARATFDDCTFATNGFYYGTPNNDMSQQQRGGAIYANATPLTMRGCRFAGNGSVVRHDTDGGTLRLQGACGGSAFTNCVWIGNTDRESYQPSTCSHGGALVVDLSGTAATVDLKNCTFAYNLSDARYAAGGLNILKGTVTAKDSIFFGNIRGFRANADGGSDVNVQSSGRFSATYTSFTATNAACVRAASADYLTLANVYEMDPLLMSSNETVTALLNATSAHYYFRTDRVAYDTLATLNAHLKGRAGYRDEVTGRIVVFRRVNSPAIDAGDPASDYSRETGNTGRRVNLGCYGNTPWATRTYWGGTQFLVR